VEHTANLNAQHDDAPSGSSVPRTRKRHLSSWAVLKVVLVLLVGTFTSNGDGSLVLATHPTIASEFNCLSASSWLFVSFSLAGAATQTLTEKFAPLKYGKLSDIYGRRLLLIIAYTLFAIGCALVGTGKSMGMVILGRIISGCGGSAMNVLGILIITDLVPLREVATWQSGINLAATTGRSLGGPVGGWLADTVGWRWSFMGQVPLFLIAIGLCLAWLPRDTAAAAADSSKLSAESGENTNNINNADDGEENKPQRSSSSRRTSSIARIDFPGATLLALTILTLLLPLEIGGTQIPWTHPPDPRPRRRRAPARRPLPRHRGPVGRRAHLPRRAPPTPRRAPDLPGHRRPGRRPARPHVRGAAVLPGHGARVQRGGGDVLGARGGGERYWCYPCRDRDQTVCDLTTTGRYKPLLLFATLASSTSYLLLLLRWHGRTSVWESLYIFPGGLGTGIVQTATFVAVQAAIDPAHKAAAMSGNFLVVTIGGMAGMVAVNAVTVETMTRKLGATLRGMGIAELARRQIIEKAASDIDYIDEANKTISAAVVEAYVEGLSASHLVSLVASISAILATLLIREHAL
ncbi:major facilitator superfamily transporter, partial [Apiospora rasikravindrae]